MIRRTNNKPLPELKLLQTKRNKEEKVKKEADSDKEFDDEQDNVILKVVSVNGDTDIKWQKIHDTFKLENKNLNVIYMRFSKNEGQIGVTKHSNSEIEFKEDLKVDNIDFKVSKCNGEDLINFWKDHGSHFEHCIGKSKRDKNKKGRNQKDKFILRKSIDLAGET